MNFEDLCGWSGIGVLLGLFVSVPLLGLYQGDAIIVIVSFFSCALGLLFLAEVTHKVNENRGVIKKDG